MLDGINIANTTKIKLKGDDNMNYDDWHRLYREEEDYEYLEYVDNELKRLRRKTSCKQKNY